MNGTTIYFDLETGGVEDHHPDIQIAAIAVRDWEEVATFERKIEFDNSLAEPEALKLNSYNPNTWREHAVPESLVVQAFASFIEQHRSLEMISKRTGRPYRVAQIAGHNVARFDAPRLQRMFQRNGGKFLAADIYRPLDTMQLALWHFRDREKPQSYKLPDLCDALGISTEGAHDALADVRMTIAVARELVERSRTAAAAA